jgi:PAS domain S-box-containing protein
MTWQITSLASTFFLSAALILGVAFVAFRHINMRGAQYFIFLVLSVEVWALFTGLEHAVVEPGGKILFGKFEYLGIATVGPTWLMFALSYNLKEKWLTRRNIILLFLIPVITVMIAFTNELHGLLWPKITPSSNIPGANLIYEHGPAFWLMFTFDYLTLAAGTFIIIDHALRARDVYRWQMLGLVASAIIPWVGNLIYVLRLSPIPGLDLTPLGFTLSAIITSFSIFYLGLFDLVPIARDQLVERLMDGVLVLDTNNRVADINPRARELMGLGRERIIGQTVGRFLEPWPDLLGQFRDVKSAQVEVHINNNTVSDIELRISPLTDEQGNLIGRLFIAQDISTRKNLEKLRDDLIRAMVHDLRNPLGSVMLSMDLLKTELTPVLTEEQLITFQTGEQSVQKILKLVNSILDINRLESGEMPLNREQISLQKIVTEAFKTQMLIATNKGIVLEKKIPFGLPAVMIDAELMPRVFQNLIDNAVKFSPNQGGVVEIGAKNNPNGREIIISITDNGPGIQGNVKNRLFEKFSTGNVKGSGSGLGLAFCRLVVEAHGGRIWLDDEAKTGTTISLSIPTL